MKQSRRHSLLEACGNTAFGYAINIGVQELVFPIFGIHVSLGQNVEIGLIFTLVSISRSYVVRRFFETYRR